MVRALGYLRVSTAGQAEKGMGLEAQRSKVEEYAREHGLELLEFVREAASGAVRDGEALSHEHRPRLLELLEQAKGGEFDVLLVARLDRLSRDHATLVFLERTFRRHGVEVISATETNGDGAYAEFMRTVIAGVAQLERAMIATRVADGRAKKREAGRVVGGQPPFGYRVEDGKLEPVPEAAQVVAGMFADARHGVSAAAIARRLNEQGVRPPKRAAAWNRQAVHLILRNPTYTGELHGVKKTHRPIVSRRLFNQAQAALRERSRTRD